MALYGGRLRGVLRPRLTSAETEWLHYLVGRFYPLEQRSREGRMGDIDFEKALEAARAAGLDRMADRYPDDVARAFAFAQSLRTRITIDVEPADEPAHVYRAAGGEL